MNAQALLEGMGWQSGQGLGRNNQGISKALKPKVQLDRTGLGLNPAASLVEPWWAKVFNHAAQSISVRDECDEDGNERVKRGKSNRKRRSSRNGEDESQNVTRHAAGSTPPSGHTIEEIGSKKMKKTKRPKKASMNEVQDAECSTSGSSENRCSGSSSSRTSSNHIRDATASLHGSSKVHHQTQEEHHGATNNLNKQTVGATSSRITETTCSSSESPLIVVQRALYTNFVKAVDTLRPDDTTLVVGEVLDKDPNTRAKEYRRKGRKNQPAENHCESGKRELSDTSSLLVNPIDDTLWRSCEGRTGHKGARYGVLKGKMSRVMRQEMAHVASLAGTATTPPTASAQA